MLQTMIVGSAPQPAWLARPFDFMTEWRLSGESLEEGQDDAVRLALDDQHDAGVDIVTDGEQRRRHYVWSFCEGLSGIDSEQRKDMPMRGARYRRPAPDITRLILPDVHFVHASCISEVIRARTTGVSTPPLTS